MPFQRERYPENWFTEIRPAIMERAGERRGPSGAIIQEARCEWCGVRNHSQVWREHKQGYTVIVLTIAHLGIALPDGSAGDKHNKMDCRPENLAALCQACHLREDLDDHIRHAAETRARKKRAQARASGQLELFA